MAGARGSGCSHSVCLMLPLGDATVLVVSLMGEIFVLPVSVRRIRLTVVVSAHSGGYALRVRLRCSSLQSRRGLAAAFWLETAIGGGSRAVAILL